MRQKKIYPCSLNAAFLMLLPQLIEKKLPLVYYRKESIMTSEKEGLSTAESLRKTRTNIICR
ncbi:MAG: hypothetical protein B6I32_07565 [Desulfobacterium sp. 4572_20]|nr:MAG: hypothetical protein B6I32_07565 [Desulfobacterium sp. 4572_20]